MTTTEIVLFIWLALQGAVLIFLCFERDRLNAKISTLDIVIGWLLTKEKAQ